MGTDSNKLLSYFPESLINKNVNWPGVQQHLDEVCEFFGAWVCLIDRTQTYNHPFNCDIRWPIPAYDPNFTLSYEEVCLLRAEQLIKHAKSKNKKIRLFYSGGIDSSVILCSFIKLLGVEETTKYIELAITENSIRENPTLWNDIVRKTDFCLLSASVAKNIVSRESITLTGECNDQLFGSDKMIFFMVALGEDSIYRKWRPEEIENFFASGSNNKHKNAKPIVQYLSNTMNAAPFKIENNYQFWWWYNFSWKWNNVATRIMYYVPTYMSDQLKNGFETEQFFNCNEFQLWSMKYHHDYPDKNGLPYEYKWEAKEFVANVINDEGFLEKTKIPSLVRALHSQFRIHGIDSNYNLITDYKDFKKYLKSN
jgi:hypothetical protein